MSTTHLLILLAVVVLIFGTKKLSNIGSDLGAAVKGFKDGVKGDGEKPADPAAPVQQVTAQSTNANANATDTIDVQAKTKS